MSGNAEGPGGNELTVGVSMADAVPLVIPSEARNLPINKRAPGKADPFLRGSGQAQVLHFVQDKLRMTAWLIFSLNLS